MRTRQMVSYLAATLLSVSASTVFAQAAITPAAEAQTSAAQATSEASSQQAAHAEGKAQWQHGEHHGKWWAKRLQRMMKMVHATEDQRHQINLIAENARHSMTVELATVPKDAKLTRQTIWEKTMTQARADIRAVLTPEQRAKLDEQMAKHQNQHKQG